MPRIVRYREQWCLYWRESGKVRRRLLTDELGQPVATKQDAERVALDVQRLAVRPTGNLISDLARKYFADKKDRIASYENMEFAWKAIEATVGHLRPEHITREWCQAHTVAERAKGRADGTIRKQLTVLSAICRWSDKRSPAMIEMPPMPPARDRNLSRDEVKKLIASAVAPHVKLFIVLAIATAARAQAILDLTWNLIDLERGLIDLGESPTRFKKRATVPMTEQARKLLTKAKEAALTDFVIEHGGKQVGSVKKGFAKAAERAGLDDVSPHVLRHTAAVWMAEGGVSMSEIAQFLGHTSEKITFRTYARFSPTHLRKASALLELE